MDKKRIGIIRGGMGDYYNSSLIKGGDVISHIFENLSDKYNIVDILIDKKDIWHLNGVPINPADLIHKIDISWNTVQHPSVSAVLNNIAVPNIENRSFLGTLESNNEMLRKHIKDVDVQMPRSIVFPAYQEDFDGDRSSYSLRKAKEVFEKFSSPWIVKSYTPDSNLGIHLAKTFPELVYAIEDGVAHNKSILVEEFILGKAGSTHSVSGFRKDFLKEKNDIYVFPPENFTADEKEKIISIVKDIHTHLGTKHYLKSDFVLHPKRGFFLIGVDFSPDLRKGSHFEKACKSVGAEMHHIFEHIVERALNKRL